MSDLSCVLAFIITLCSAVVDGNTDCNCPCNEEPADFPNKCGEFCLDNGSSLNQTNCQDCCNSCCPYDGNLNSNLCKGFVYSDEFGCTLHQLPMLESRALMPSFIDGVLGKCEEIPDPTCPPCDCTTTPEVLPTLKPNTCNPCPCKTCDPTATIQPQISTLAGDAKSNTTIVDSQHQTIEIDNNRATESTIFVLETRGFPDCHVSNVIEWNWRFKVADGPFKITLVELQMNNCSGTNQGLWVNGTLIKCYTAGMTFDFDSGDTPEIDFKTGISSMSVFRIWIVVKEAEINPTTVSLTLISSDPTYNDNRGQYFSAQRAMSISECEVYSPNFASTNYVVYPNGAENVGFIAELGTELVPAEIGLANTNNGHWRDRGTKDFKIETSTDLENWTLFATGQLPDSRTQPCPIPVHSIAHQGKPSPAKYLKITLANYWGSGSGLQGVKVLKAYN